MANLIGRTLGKYQITERRGKGGMAEVYKAYHPKLDRFVAIKILHSFLVEGEDFIARFEREAKAVALLRHPHIVQIHDFDVDDDMVYMVMEYIDGETLQSKMSSHSKSSTYMPIGQVQTLLRQVAEALDYAHEHKIIHRDIKPANILLDSSGVAYLSDFGIARMMGGTQFTSTGSLIGTPTYMSPEQGEGLEPGKATDIYSLGIVIYELLTGKAPFAADTPLAVIHKHVHETLPKPGLLRPDLPADVEKILRKALAKEPQDRYQNAVGMIADLEKAFTPETIARLDAFGSKAGKSVAALPTLHMDEPSIVDRAHLPTQAMGAKTRTEIATPPVVSKKTKSEPAKKAATRHPDIEPSPVLSRKTSAATIWKRLRSRPLIIGGIGLAVVLIAVVIILIILPWGSSCGSIQSCQAQAEQMRSQGDLEGYIANIDGALAQVSASDHPGFAMLWCDRGDAARELGWREDAINSYTNCLNWTGLDPALQPLRDRASRALTELQ